MELSRRNFVVAGTVGALTAFSGTTAAQQVETEPGDFQPVAQLVGPEAARPEPGDVFFENKEYFAYIYTTNLGDRFYRTQNMGSWQELIKTAVGFKAHRPDPITNQTTNAWTSIGGFSAVSDESPNEAISLDANNQSVNFHRAGLYRFNGCLKFQNNTTGQQTVRLLLRLYANGTTEMRCSQRQWLETLNQDSQRTVPFGGTDVLGPGESVELQYWTDNDTVDFAVDSRFDNGVVSTISVDYLGPMPS